MNLRPAISNVATLAVSMALSVLAAEAALSLFLDRPLTRILPEVKYQDHAIRWYSHRPDQEGYTFGAPFRIGMDGFRQNGQDGLETSSRRVVALGDSFTFGIGVGDDETWPSRLEAKLNADSESYSVVNAGVVGYGAFQIDSLVAESNLAEGTDVVVYALYWNDYLTAGPPRPGAVRRISDQGYFRWDVVNRIKDNRIDPKRWLIEHSFMLSMLRDLRNSTGEPGPYAREYQKLLSGQLVESDFEPISRLLEHLQRLQSQHDFKLAVVILPVKDLLGTRSSYPGIIRSTLDKRGIKYLDAFTMFEKIQAPADYFLPERVDIHLNARGYEVLAEGVHEMLHSHGLIGKE